MIFIDFHDKSTRQTGWMPLNRSEPDKLKGEMTEREIEFWALMVT